MNLLSFCRRHILVCFLIISVTDAAKAQTDLDYDMMAKKLFCSGFTYTYSSWDHYWEGTLKRTNENLGTVSTQMISYMGNYGLTKKINLLFNVPYVKTKASAGHLGRHERLSGLKSFCEMETCYH